jgi:hypothetical protein
MLQIQYLICLSELGFLLEAIFLWVDLVLVT